MKDRIEELASLFARFPGIGPRQAKRFVFHLLAVSQADRTKLSELVKKLGDDVRQCVSCMRFMTGNGASCSYCTDSSRDDSLLLVVEKDQDLSALERSHAYRGHYFVLGGVLTLSDKGAIREKELLRLIERKVKTGLTEVVLALSATTEGEHTADRVKELLLPFRNSLKISILGRGLATGSELEYADTETLTGALQNRKET